MAVPKIGRLLRRKSRFALALMLATALVAGAAVTAALAGGTHRQLTSVNVRMDFFAAGYHSAFYVAKAKGWYAKEGLDVTIDEGQGSSSTAQLVASGKETFGFISPVAMIQTIAGGGHLKMIFDLHQKDGSGVLVPVGRGITQPKDLEGKTCAISPFGYIHQLLPAFFAKTGVDPSKVKLITLGFDALIPSVAAGKVDADCEALAWGEPISFKTLYNLDIIFMSFAKYGVGPPGHGIVVNTDFLAANPSVVKAFLRATLKGYRYESDNPQAAVQILDSSVNKAFNTAAGDVAILKRSKQLWVVANTKGKPLGWMNRTNWINVVHLMTQYMHLSPAPGLDQLFTNDYVPGWKGNPLPK